jgi:O-antigen/teichoic acid export membrane protein
MSLRKKSSLRSDLTRGSLSGALQVVVATVLVVLTIPLFIRTLGQEAWGVFSVITLVGSANTFANLGLNSALVRFLAEQGKIPESDHDILVTLLLLLGVTLPLTILGFVFEQFVILKILNVPATMSGEAIWLYRSMLVCNVLVLVGQTFTAVLDAQQKVHLTNFCQLVYALLYWGLILVVILLRLPLRMMGVAILISATLWFVTVVVSMLTTWGRPSARGIRANFRRLARKQLTYGLQLFSAGLIGFFYEPLARILIANFLGMREVGLFEIGLRARNLLTSLAVKILYPLYPLLSSRTDHEGIRSIVHDVEQKSLLLVAPLIGITLLAAYPLVNFFFDANVDVLTVTILWMVSSYLLGSVTITPFYQFLMAKGHASRTVLVQALNVITNTAVFFILLPSLGYYAAVAGNVASNALTWALLQSLQWRYLNTGILDSWRQAGVVLLVMGIPAVVSVFVPLSGVGMWGVLLAPVAVGLLAAYTYRLSGIVSVKDVARYLGDNTAAARMCARLLCKEPLPPLPIQGV